MFAFIIINQSCKDRQGRLKQFSNFCIQTLPAQFSMGTRQSSNQQSMHKESAREKVGRAQESAYRREARWNSRWNPQSCSLCNAVVSHERHIERWTTTLHTITMDQRRLSPMYANYEDLRASEVPSPGGTNSTHITIMPSVQQQQEEQLARQEVPQPSGSGAAGRAASVPQYRGFKTCKNPSHR